MNTMKKNFTILRETKIRNLFVLFVLIFFHSNQSLATTKTSIANGSWNNPAIWSPWGLPLSADTIIVNTNLYYADAQMAGASATYLEITSNGSLVSVDGTGSVLFVAEEINIIGTFTAMNVIFPEDVKISGNVDIVNEIVIGEACVNSGTINVGQHFIVGSTLLNEGTGEINCYDYFTVGGGAINRGAINVIDFATIGETLSNSGTIHVNGYFTVGSTVNTGIIDVVGYSSFAENTYNMGEISSDTLLWFGDSLANNGTIYSQLDLYVLGKLENNGPMSGANVHVHQGENNASIQAYTSFTVLDSTYAIFNTFENNDTINCFGDLVSEGKFVNNGGLFAAGKSTLFRPFINNSNAFFQIGDTLVNKDTLDNWGQIMTEHLFNQAQVTGTNGTYCIVDAYINDSIVDGTIDVCDASPSSGNDSNSGTIAGTVTSCVVSPCQDAGLSIEESNSIKVSIYPNPSLGDVTINIEDNQDAVFQLYSGSGQLVKEINLADNITRVSRDNLDAGIYVYLIISGNEKSQGKLVFN